MKTKLISHIIAACFLLSAGAAVAQSNWRNISSPQWGLSYKLPPTATRQPYTGQRSSVLCELYTAGDFAFLIEVTPTPADTLASTAIEQTIQADMKEAAKLGETKRWEATSKQGDLFKGFTGPVQFSATDASCAAVVKVLGGDKGVGSAALVPLGDETGPVLRITVMSKTGKQAEVAAMAKTISSMVTRQPAKITTTSAPKPPEAVPTPPPAPAPAPAPKPEPAPAVKPWPELVSGKIELVGIVDSISEDGKTVMMTVDTIRMPGQDPVDLSPKRAKKVLLPAKMNTLIKGLRIRLIGRNDGVGKPITADAVELTPVAPEPEPEGPPGPPPVT